MGCSSSKPAERPEADPSRDTTRVTVQPSADGPPSSAKRPSGTTRAESVTPQVGHGDAASPEGASASRARASAPAAAAGSDAVVAKADGTVDAPRVYGEATLPSWDPNRGTGTPGAISVTRVAKIEDVYEILPTKLGKGSFGEVMLARRISDAGKDDAPLFAIKKLRPDVRTIAKVKTKRIATVARAARKLSEISVAARGMRGDSSPRDAASGPTAAVKSGAGKAAAVAKAAEVATPASAKAGGLAAAAAGIGESKSAALEQSKATAHLEGDIMNRVRGHRNVVNLEDIVEDEGCVHLVMEYCRGGDLMKYVVRCSHFSEKVASYLFRQMLVGVAHCHARGVVHRDLKPENFLFASTEGKAELKIADFGLATIIEEPGAEIIDGVGSAFFIAPEVLQRRYTSACDTWSLGVNLYLLLSGTVPFGADATKATEVYKAIRSEPLTFSGPAWGAISPLARELVAGLLEKQPFRRYTLAQALAHPWVTGDGAAPDTPLDSSIIRAMTHFNARNRLRREALRLISSTLSADDLKVLAGQFHAMDTDADMLISYKELAAAIRKLGVGESATEAEVMRAMEAMDADKDGTIDLQEFLAATSELQMIEHQNNIWWAFCQYDKNGDGTITLDELREVLKGDAEEELQAYIKEYDADNDGTISYEEFIRMLVPPDMEFTTIRY